jgi:hypothetical protein
MLRVNSFYERRPPAAVMVVLVTARASDHWIVFDIRGLGAHDANRLAR